jgi:hypothetical protein
MLSITELCISVDEGDWVRDILIRYDDVRIMEEWVTFVIW